MKSLTTPYSFAHAALRDLLAIAPLILSQALQIIFHVIDNRYVAQLGADALYLHGIQLTFASIGITIGGVSATSALVFWRRREGKGSARSIFMKHFNVTLGISFLFSIVGLIFLDPLIAHYKFSEAFAPVAGTYLLLGFIQLVLLSVLGALNGMLVGARQQKYCFILALLLALGNWVSDIVAVQYIFPTYGVGSALTFIGSTTVLLLGLAWIAAYSWLSPHLKSEGFFRMRDLLPVWSSEAGIGFVRCISPFLMMFQLAEMAEGKSFITTYSLALQIAYLCFVPLIAGMQIAIRDASKAVSYGDASPLNNWWRPFLYFALGPSLAFALIGFWSGPSVLSLFYSYSVPVEHYTFLRMFFAACLLGQISDIFVVPLRARKANALITRNIFLSELYLLVGMRFLLATQAATPSTVGALIASYALIQMALQSSALSKVAPSKKRSEGITSPSYS